MTTTHDDREKVSAASCGCGAGGGGGGGGGGEPGEGAAADANGERHAIGVDPEIKARNLRRLKRIEGQVRGLQRMVTEDRYCADIMTQVASVQEALRAVGRELMRNHLRYCATAAIRSGEESAETMYDEIIDLMYKNVR